MKIRSVNLGWFCVLAVFMAAGCTSDRYPMDEIISLGKSFYATNDTTYLEIFPPFQLGFNGPTAVLSGADQLLYVADTKNNRVVMMDVAGGYLGECRIDNPISLAQDFRLDLLVGGTVNKNGVPAGALFRIHLLQAEHHFDQAQMHIDTIRKESSYPHRRFVGIGVMPDNFYFVARTGPDNSSSIDPDTRIMKFDTSDEYITPITDLMTGVGTGINYINQLTGLTIYPSSKNFIALQRNTGVAYGAVWMEYKPSGDFDGYLPKYDPANPRDGSVDFIRPNRFIYPAGIAIDPKRLDIFVVDLAQDSVFKFNSRGAFKAASFGRYRTFNRMKSPMGAAYFDKTLFIADSTANCIFRFKLASDF